MNTNQIQLTAEDKQTRREFTIMQIIAVIVILVALFSITSSIYESLRTAFPFQTALSIAFGAALAYELAFSLLIIASINLFAPKGKDDRENFKISKIIYFISALILTVGVLFLGNMFRENIHAVGAKTRAFKFAVDYNKHPLILNAKNAIAEIAEEISSIDKQMLEIQTTLTKNGMAASIFSASVRDTSFYGRRRSNEIWQAMKKEGGEKSNLGKKLVDMSTQRNKLVSAKLLALGRLDSLYTAFAKEQGGKSPEDIIEANLGINFLSNIAFADIVVGLIGVFVWHFIPIIRDGKIKHNPIAFVPASGAMESANSATTKAPEPDFIMPQRLTNESKQQYALRVAQMYSRGEFSDFVNATYLAGRLDIKCGTFSKLVHGKLGKTYFSNGTSSTKQITA